MTKDEKNASRLHAIHELLKRYRSKAANNTAGYYVHPALSYETDTWGGIKAQVTEAVLDGTVLFVTPNEERFSWSNIAPLLEPKSLRHKYLPAVLQECERVLTDTLETDNIICALLIMYLWKNRRSVAEKNKDDPPAELSNLDLFLQTWPSTDDLEKLYMEPTPPVLKDTYAGYYLEQRHNAVEQILDCIFQCLPDPKLRERFCDDPSRPGFTKVFRWAWKIVDSRAHEGLPNEQIKFAILPIIDLTNGISSGSKHINAEILTDFWENIRKKLPDTNNSSNSKNSTGTAKKSQRTGYLPATYLYAVGDLKPYQELLLDYGELPPSSFLIKYGCVPTQFLEEPQLMTDSVLLQYPLSLAPKDQLRIDALRQNDFPTEPCELQAKEFWAWLTPDDLDALAKQLPLAKGESQQPNYIEPENLKRFRQYVLIARIGDDDMVRTYKETFRIQGTVDSQKLFHSLILIVDYNISLLSCQDGFGKYMNKHNSTTNASEMKLLQNEECNLSFLEKTCIIQRILYRDALLQWRHVLCRFYGIPSLVDVNNNNNNSPKKQIWKKIEYEPGCNVCGRAVPFKRCSRCGQVGYCGREHQTKDWKGHKKSCVSKT